MVDYISNSNNDILINNANIKQHQELIKADQKTSTSTTTTTATTPDISDKSDISDAAKKLYEQEQEKQQYSKAIMSAVSNKESISQIIDLINTGKYLNNDDLAQSLSNNSDFMSMLNLNQQSA